MAICDKCTKRKINVQRMYIIGLGIGKPLKSKRRLAGWRATRGLQALGDYFLPRSRERYKDVVLVLFSSVCAHAYTCVCLGCVHGCECVYAGVRGQC